MRVCLVWVRGILVKRVMDKMRTRDGDQRAQEQHNTEGTELKHALATQYGIVPSPPFDVAPRSS
jgi:hypothetical protein